MIRKRLFGLIAMVVCAGATGTIRAGDKYQDQKIMPKHEHVIVHTQSMPQASEMDFEWPVTVERVDGQWLWIRNDGSYSMLGRPVAGWISKNDVILIKDDPIENKKSAHDYYTEQIQRDSNAGWAYWLRGVLYEAEDSDWPAATLPSELASTPGGIRTTTPVR
jgi:hypothetical protein